eukprot:CAMPEP_0170514398 /NCGR_PEP_ID=MMETSP0209-20121228/958_1 /TAXON_ID=665100 ORGANISM="Litonotus pictus, Strain P1" /NCGR_SAMPLE_ID=MMETSP0209 /ASSEMBLY_ACC=CAM_ASM_000301 /LENGTH=201 /DNA_ID=CAMNT_0010798465 /DNA_START=39 /DNA_END=644 /DNA_ORIENTATION=+
MSSFQSTAFDYNKTYQMKMYYKSYTPKTKSGETVTAEDYHEIMFKFSDGTIPAEVGPIFTWFYNTVGPVKEADPVGADTDQSTINYHKQYYMPNLPDLKYAYSRKSLPNGTPVTKYFVMYNIQGSCETSVPTTNTRVKYFYCLKDAEDFFASTDAQMGSGTDPKLIHDGTDFRDTTLTIDFASTTGINLKEYMYGYQVTCG